MRRTRNAKIVSTLGPASSTEASIAELFEAGTDVFRLNFSHGTHADHQNYLDIIRRLESRFDRPVGVMLDLQGPKLRVGDIAGGSVELTDDMPYRLDLTGEQGDARRASLPHPEIFAALKADMDLLIDDGKIRLRVVECGADWAETRVVIGGTLSDHKGVNVPSAVLDLSPLTEKDHRDLRFGLELGVDWVALSFVQRPDDVAEARKIVGARAGILVKLEKPSAIDHLDGIIELADALMVARGDLGVEMPPEDVPGLQKRIIRACRHAGKPIVVATQMLESMIHAPTPTRAEASDVATAVYDGADAVMLSAETAAGGYAVESVAMMNRIVNRVERDPLYRTILEAERYDPEETAADAITAAARQVAQTIGASAIVTFTTTGSTTLRAARERPPVPILGLTPRGDTARRLSLVWGVHSVETVDLKDFREMVSKATDIAVREDFAVTGDRLVITAGVPFGTPGATNILRIAWAE
ncbi:MAG: pyruvate kinase [Rhodospirillales bacterium]|jgi:pyruvate kinase|nr:pyruvate kinase [Rhodospirillales bacterium]